MALAAGERVEYARALAEVAERSLESGFSPAPAFSNRANPSGLRDRIQRLLVPGYRPGLRLTWQGLAGLLVSGAVMLVLCALGTQWTVRAAAKLLTPQERIAQIETNLASMGQDPATLIREGEAERVSVNAVVRAQDGSPLPRNRQICFTSHWKGGNSSSSFITSIRPNGSCHCTLPRGDLYIQTWLDGFAPVSIGPINTRTNDAVDDLEVVLERGFPISIRAVDAESGAPLSEADLQCSFFGPKTSSKIGNPKYVTTDKTGTTTLEDCALFPLHIVVKADGYETTEKVFDHWRTNDTLQVSGRRSLPIAGFVSDKETGQPVGDGSIYAVRALDAPGVDTVDLWQPGNEPLAITGADGHFVIDQLPRSGRYWLVVRAPGLGGTLLSEVRAGQTNLVATLRTGDDGARQDRRQPGLPGAARRQGDDDR